MLLLMVASTSSSEAQVRVVSFSVSPSNVKLRGGSMTISRHGIAMTTLFLIMIVIFITAIRIWRCHLSPARHRISVMARIRHSFWRLSLGCKSKFLKKVKSKKIINAEKTYAGTGRPLLSLGLNPLPFLFLWPPKKRCLRMWAWMMIWRAFWAPCVNWSPKPKSFSWWWKTRLVSSQYGSGTSPGPPKHTDFSFWIEL